MRKATRFSLMAVTVILITQLYSVISVSQAFQSENRNRTYSMRVDQPSQPGMRGRRGRRGRGGYGNWCWRRCRREYSACLGYAGGNAGRRRACAVRYRNCIRRCS
ncbi:MAG: hypothetical protein ICV60_08685 [Pyrinomonadaceae bacterium]|nr:hypothetical protein [Pyrinomonadaceae bacterium]